MTVPWLFYFDAARKNGTVYDLSYPSLEIVLKEGDGKEVIKSGFCDTNEGFAGRFIGQVKDGGIVGKLKILRSQDWRTPGEYALNLRPVVFDRKNGNKPLGYAYTSIATIEESGDVLGEELLFLGSPSDSTVIYSLAEGQTSPPFMAEGVNWNQDTLRFHVKEPLQNDDSVQLHFMGIVKGSKITSKVEGQPDSHLSRVMTIEKRVKETSR
jgi:hypothetical protein